MGSNIQTIDRTIRTYSTAMLVCCVLIVSNALADETVRSETVKFQDLNVGTPAGVEALYSRIHSAAKRVCAETDPVMQAAAIACVRTAEARAIERVNLPLLTNYYRMKTGKPVETIVAKR